MMEVTLKEISTGAATLKRLADNAKLPPSLFFKIRNAWRDVNEQVELLQQKVQVSIDEHYVMIGDRGDVAMKSIADRQAHERMVQVLFAEIVPLPHVKAKIQWTLIEEAKIEPPLTPAEVVALEWLIELPDDE